MDSYAVDIDGKGFRGYSSYQEAADDLLNLGYAPGDGHYTGSFYLGASRAEIKRVKTERRKNIGGNVVEKQMGTITNLRRHKGIGFITKEDGSQIFFHLSGVLRPEYEDLREGYVCEFIEVPSNPGPKAIAIIAHEDIEP